MRTPPLFRCGLLAVLVASSVAQASDERDTPAVRPIMLSEHPRDGTHSIYVKGQIVTTLRFEQLVDFEVASAHEHDISTGIAHGNLEVEGRRLCSRPSWIDPQPLHGCLPARLRRQVC